MMTHESKGAVAFFYHSANFKTRSKHSGALVEKVRGEQAQRQLRRELNLLGRLIAAECAKDNGARKIDTAALRSWSKRLLKAKNEDDGSGHTITMEIDTIGREAETFLTK